MVEKSKTLFFEYFLTISHFFSGLTLHIVGHTESVPANNILYYNIILQIRKGSLTCTSQPSNLQFHIVLAILILVQMFCQMSNVRQQLKNKTNAF